MTSNMYVDITPSLPRVSVAKPHLTVVPTLLKMGITFKLLRSKSSFSSLVLTVAFVTYIIVSTVCCIEAVPNNRCDKAPIASVASMDKIWIERHGNFHLFRLSFSLNDGLSNRKRDGWALGNHTLSKWGLFLFLNAIFLWLWLRARLILWQTVHTRLCRRRKIHHEGSTCLSTMFHLLPFLGLLFHLLHPYSLCPHTQRLHL
mmetsp:Transcript_7460/g.10700  ORF Transcript_7460/g.10700 Transcript_7460/m.10700 type:complete len:202 (-) Transcript_7460:574-1179(-)